MSALMYLVPLLLPSVLGFPGFYHNHNLHKSQYHKAVNPNTFSYSRWSGRRPAFLPLSSSSNTGTPPTGAPIHVLPQLPSPKSVPSIVEMPSTTQPILRGVLLVDPFSRYHSGYMTDLAAHKYGVGVVRVLSPYMAKGLQLSLLATTTASSLHSQEQQQDVMASVAPLDLPALGEWVDQIPFAIQAVICESDSGLAYAEQLACALERLGVVELKHNGYQEARRDKFAMNELCRHRGVKVVAQTLCGTVEECVAQAKENFGCGDDATRDSTPIIVKPRRGVASDRVALCRSLKEIPSAVDAILDATVFGTYDVKHDAVLLQEYVDGAEYAIDVVSKDGVHKVAALWVYDRTSTSDDGITNPFAYLSGRLLSATDHDCLPGVMDYVEACLTALDVRWGMTHSEVKVQQDGSIRLMEVNVRQQNDNFGPLCDACVGYNAMELCLSAYLEESGLFEAVPNRPSLRYHGMIVNLACFVEGTVSEIHHIAEIEQLESVQAMEIYPGFDVGQTIRRTVDIRSDCGWVHLVNESEDDMMCDYQKICEWMPTIFDIK